MKSSTFKICLIAITLITTSCSNKPCACDKLNTKIESINNKLEECSSKNIRKISTITERIVPIRKINNRESNLYNTNLQIIDSESNIDISNNYIHIKTPLANNKYKHYNTIDISSKTRSALAYHISDNKSNSTIKEPMEYILEDLISLSELKNPIIKKEVTIIIYNEEPNNFNTEDIKKLKTIINEFGPARNGSRVNCVNKMITQPEEACGGILQVK